MNGLVNLLTRTIGTLTLLLTLPVAPFAQGITLQGSIRDAHSEENIPFASVRLLKAGGGALSDSAGNFSIYFKTWPNDSLEITYVGYEPYRLAINPLLFEKAVDKKVSILILMQRARYATDIIVKRKIDRGLLMWKRIVKRKPKNDRYQFQNFSYELYNKLEVDLKNVHAEKWQKVPIIKNYGFVFNNIDTTEQGKPFLPVYLTEAISDYYYQRSPKKRREVFKGTKTIGFNNESVAKLLGGMDQNINCYSNFIPIFDKQYVSPLSDNGDLFYQYKVLDTQYVNHRRMIHMQFVPKRKGESTFEGDCWVHDTTWAVQKINFRLPEDANINFVDKLSLIQEFTLLNDSTWFLSRDKFVVDFSFSGENRLSAIGRKTTTYRHVLINDSSIAAAIAQNKLAEETIFPSDAKTVNDDFWLQSRHEQLNKNEVAIYKTIDTLLKMPSFQHLTKRVTFLGTGYLPIGNYEIGPWFNWMTYNTLEGYRMRFDLGTTTGFNKKLYIHGYGAYGFNDHRWKGSLEARYIFKKNPRHYLRTQYFNDIDYGQQYYDEITQDNIFALAIRKSGIPIKFMGKQEVLIEHFNELRNGLSFSLGSSYKNYQPLLNLPTASIFPLHADSRKIATFETSLKLRFAYLEKFLDGDFYRYSLGSVYPITELKYTRGIAGVGGSQYNYNKLSYSISDYTKLPPFGSFYFNVFGGYTFGTLPYMLLDVAPGNEIYYYNKYAFNLMNRYEYLHDRYMGINIEHNIGNGIFKFMPLTRKLKFRQFWTLKTLWGSLREANKNYNMPVGSNYTFSSLDGKTYAEIGTGVDNIFKVFRIDWVWRVAPRPLPVDATKRFGMFASFRLAF